MARSVLAVFAFVVVFIVGRLAATALGAGDLSLGDTLAISIPSILATLVYVGVKDAP